MAVVTFLEGERKMLVGVLKSLTPATLDAMTYVALEEGIATYGSAIDPMPVLAVNFLRWIAPQPSLMQAFLIHLCDELPSLPEKAALLALADRLGRLSAIVAAADPVDACLIDTAVMVNRAAMRSVLRRLVRNAVVPVVVIEGTRQSGRSHSRHLIRHVGKAHQVMVTYIDLEAWIVEQRTLDRLVDKVAAAFDLPPPARFRTEGLQPETVGMNYARDLSEAFDGKAVTLRRWLVFDSLDRPMKSEITAFIRALCDLRLRAELRDCTFFLLGNGTYLNASDNVMTQKETLGRFVPAELIDSAEQINRLGETPLSPADLRTRIDAMQAAFDACTDEACSAIAAHRLAALRQEVCAP